MAFVLFFKLCLFSGSKTMMLCVEVYVLCVIHSFVVAFRGILSQIFVNGCVMSFWLWFAHVL